MSEKLTQELLEKIIRSAFKCGEVWGRTYQGWFIPSEKDTEERMQLAIENIAIAIDTRSNIEPDQEG